MQTFLPYADFEACANVLDWKRLNKQITEGEQILTALNPNTKSNAWKNHPAVLMWKGYETALMLYINVMHKVWDEKYAKKTRKNPYFTIEGEVKFPPWLGMPTLHASHRSNLLRKNKEFYSKFNWSEPSDMEYVWPTKL